MPMCDISMRRSTRTTQSICSAPRETSWGCGPRECRPRLTLWAVKKLDESYIFDGVEPNFQHSNILAGLREAHDERQQLDERVTTIVAAAREYGISWQGIGQALGVSKQTAWNRFGWLDKRFSPQGLSFMAVRGQLASWNGQRVRVLIQGAKVDDWRRQGQFFCMGVVSSDMLTCWVGPRQDRNSFIVEPGSFVDARFANETLIVELTGGQIEITPLEPEVTA
jgi:hypothetical protein